LAEALELFVGDSVAAYVTQTRLSLESTKLQVRSIIEKVFSLKLSSAIAPSQDILQDFKSDLLWNNSFSDKLSILKDFLGKRRPVLLVGGPRTGKQTLTETAAKLLHFQLYYLIPDVTGTFREIYGEPDPLSFSAYCKRSQLGPVAKPIISKCHGDASRHSPSHRGVKF
jgi:midasin (ATPase involved in ribosome maturation)